MFTDKRTPPLFLPTMPSYSARAQFLLGHSCHKEHKKRLTWNVPRNLPRWLLLASPLALDVLGLKQHLKDLSLPLDRKTEVASGATKIFLSTGKKILFP